MVMRVRKVLTGAPSLRRTALRKAMKEKHTRRPKVARTGGREGGKDTAAPSQEPEIENTLTNVL